MQDDLKKGVCNYFHKFISFYPCNYNKKIKLQTVSSPEFSFEGKSKYRKKVLIRIGRKESTQLSNNISNYTKKEMKIRYIIASSLFHSVSSLKSLFEPSWSMRRLQIKVPRGVSNPPILGIPLLKNVPTPWKIGPFQGIHTHRRNFT